MASDQHSLRQEPDSDPFNRSQVDAAFSQWTGRAPDMSILNRAQLPAPTLDLSVFGPWSSWLTAAAEAMSAPVDYIAVSLLVVAAGLIGATRWVSPWDGWKVPCLLWGMLVGPPSAGKSPAMGSIRGALDEIERDDAAAHSTNMRTYENGVAAAIVRRRAWQAEASDAATSGRPVPILPTDAVVPQEPAQPRVLITDITVEASSAVLSGNPRGVLLWRDEMSAWLSKKGEEAYDGGTYMIDRVKHGKPLRIPYHAISILGGVQPDSLVSSLLAKDDDGLAARCMYTWPDSVPPRRPSGTTDGSSATNVDSIVRAFRRLHSVNFQTRDGDSLVRVVLPVEEPGLLVFQSWRVRHFQHSQAESGLMASALGKMPGLVLRLAVVLEYLWWAAGEDGLPEPVLVSHAALEAALEFVEDYLKPMLRRVLGDSAQPRAEKDATTLARAIADRKPTTINSREVQRAWRLSGLRVKKDVDAAIQVLIELNWLLPVEVDSGRPGRPRSDFRVHPDISGVLHESTDRS